MVHIKVEVSFKSEKVSLMETGDKDGKEKVGNHFFNFIRTHKSTTQRCLLAFFPISAQTSTSIVPCTY